MTGYGRASLQGALGNVNVEIKGHNRRYLELSFQLTRPLASFELELTRLVQEQVGRGHLVVEIRYSPALGTPSTLELNIERARELKGAYSRLAEALSLEPRFELRDFLSQEVIIDKDGPERDEKVLELLLGGLKEALDSFRASREREGEILAEDLRGRLAHLKLLIDQIEEHSRGLFEKFRSRLTSRLSTYFSPESSEDKERLMKEVVFFVDRADISEEIVRFGAHLRSFLETLTTPLSSRVETKGKKLDFLVQELMREIGTISAKAQEIEITRCALEIKCELEKMREQVQNIE